MFTKSLQITIAIVFIFSNFIISCKDKNTYTNLTDSTISTNPQDKHQLLVQHCNLCHNPNATKESSIAPPMIAIKEAYLKAFPDKSDFIAAFQHFLEKPTPTKAILKDDVKKYGVMPYQHYTPETIEAIASFIYDYKIPSPEWYINNWQQKHQTTFVQQGADFFLNEAIEDYETIGLKYALDTKALLGKNLMGAIQNEGTLAALQFCNIQAMPLTDSMAVQYNANIKRVSDKNRNPNNLANTYEKQLIKQYAEDIQNGVSLKPVVVENKTNVNFYYPIETNTMCLQCHGKNITTEISKEILRLYPEDLATGYEENQIRGIWSITFNK
jgi:cytochrome c553